MAIVESVLQPYAEKTREGGRVSAIISVLIEKVRQDIKLEQYDNPNTFLVLNLALIHPGHSGSSVLRPVYCEDHPLPTAVTGTLWMLAFARQGMLVHGIPEFEGASAIEGIIDKSGILVDPEYSRIAGMLVVVYPLGNKPCIYGLYRHSDFSRWNETDPELILTLSRLTQENWNSDLDSNGWRLSEVRRGE